MSRFSAYLKKDGWILASLIFCVALCLMLGSHDSIPATEEDRLRQVLSAIDGAGSVDIAVYYEESVPCGAVVVAQGARDVAVQLRLVSAVTTLLGIHQERVAIYPMEEQR